MPFTPPFRPVGPVRPTRGRAAGAGGAAAFALALLLGGCAGAPTPSPSGTPSASEAAPIFASDEEALAAAEAAYESYLAVSTAVSNDGGAEPDRLAAVATGGALDEEEDAARDLADQGVRTVGTVGFQIKELQSFSASVERAEVVVYLCEDLRNLDVLDASGKSLVVEGRVVDVPYTVVVSADRTDDLKVSEKDLWPRDNFCLQ